VARPKKDTKTIGIIDIFAGPGGLGEGFSSFQVRGRAVTHPFRLGVSAEMERTAHQTLRLRAFYRLLRARDGHFPSTYATYLRQCAEGTATPPEDHFGSGKLASIWQEAAGEALNLTLGQPDDNSRLYERIEQVKRRHERMVLIGGPPCQAYSLVGRSRQKNVKGFRSNGDHRHFLYREYLGILAKFAPDVFIMENVKGILTSTVGEQNMFAQIQSDLSNPSLALGKAQSGKRQSDEYVLLPIHVEPDGVRSAVDVASDPTGFVIRCENHGVPQARHRVIIMGVRADHASRAFSAPGLDLPESQVRVSDALAGLPRLRSGLSRQPDDAKKWMDAIEQQKRMILSALPASEKALASKIEHVAAQGGLPRNSIDYREDVSTFAKGLRSAAQDVVLNHETRGHMPSDLGRYLFCSTFGLEYGRSPTSGDFPKKLAPEHANWGTGHFQDRFKVQVKGKPSSTVTSHLSKDGHAFIHWDAAQCRSMTVREAARLQTFPDDYLFLGNRTQQYVQVGNAVPPILARQIANVVWSILS
jgi:DNA (cytosine-5)-methyltransferase 1